MMGQNDEDVEDPKGEGGDGREIDRNHGVEVIANECRPVGRGSSVQAVRSIASASAVSRPPGAGSEDVDRRPAE